MKDQPPFLGMACLLMSLAALPAVPACAGDGEAPLSPLRAELEQAGHRCEARPDELLCTNGTIAAYASSAAATLSAARVQGERTYCGKYAAEHVEKGLFEGRSFTEVRVLSSTITATGALVCVISYRR